MFDTDLIFVVWPEYYIFRIIDTFSFNFLSIKLKIQVFGAPSLSKNLFIYLQCVEGESAIHKVQCTKKNNRAKEQSRFSLCIV